MKTLWVHESDQEVFIDMDRKKGDSVWLLSPQTAALRKLPLSVPCDSKEDFTEIQPKPRSYASCASLPQPKKQGSQSAEKPEGRGLAGRDLLATVFGSICCVS